MFICNHCPFVVHIRPELKKLTDDYLPHNVRFIAINSNDIESYPQDGPTFMAELVKDEGWDFPFLYDEDQEAAVFRLDGREHLKVVNVACTNPRDYHSLLGGQQEEDGLRS